MLPAVTYWQHTHTHTHTHIYTSIPVRGRIKGKCTLVQGYMIVITG